MKFTTLMASTALAITSTFALADAPKYAADVPENVLTPDVVETDTLGRCCQTNSNQSLLGQ